MTREKVQVRQAGEADVPQVASLFALYRQFYGKPYDIELAAVFLQNRLQRRESVVLLAEFKEGGPVGFTQLYPGFSSVSAAPAWILNDLYVTDSARGSGAASALMKGAEKLARQAGAAYLALETARDNSTAQRLYVREGYEVEEGYLHYQKALT